MESFTGLSENNIEVSDCSIELPESNTGVSENNIGVSENHRRASEVHHRASENNIGLSEALQDKHLTKNREDGMAETKSIYVAFLWHMHQPWYLWEEHGDAAMPWVRLHALKDYYDMALLAEQTGFPATINLVPSLLKQIDLLAKGESTDVFWEAFVPDMHDMSETQLNLVTHYFFGINQERHIRPSARYSELLGKKGSANDWRVFSAQEIRDLQVHFILAWFGQSLREIPQIRELLNKDREYSAEDKNLLIEVASRRLKEIIPYYRKLARNNAIELTVSPYYHPILPLLCDINAARAANPIAALPREPFMYPGDAMRQVGSAVEYFKKLMGVRPSGLWPSEGSVSEGILPILVDAGINYIFSDEDILRKSLEISSGEPTELTPQRLYQPYRLHRGRSIIDIFFRDKRISDKIGFVYFNWNEDDAVEDFVTSLLRIRNALPAGDDNYIVPVIMDGENAWEYYKQNGKPFLKLLYEELLKHPSIIPITFEAFLKQATDVRVLDRLAAGSWINADFSTWCGSKEKNIAWELLSKTRSHFQFNADSYPDDVRKQIMEHLMIAEGSDWFWWFGETNYTPHIDTFDALFRYHLRRVYQLMDEPISPELETPIQVGERPYEPVRKPLQFMTPSLEGKATTYFEWSSAGFYKATGFRGTMYSASDMILHRLFFGFDPENLYLRLDSTHHLINFLRNGGSFMFEFLAPTRIDLEIFYDGDDLCWQAYKVEEREREEIVMQGIEIVCDQICEMKLPFAALEADPKNPIRFVVYVQGDSMLKQRFPPGGRFIEIQPPDDDFEDRMWYV